MFIPDESLSRHKQAKHKVSITSCFPATVRKSTSMICLILMELWILTYMSSAHWALFIHTSNCNFHELKTSTKVVGLLVLSRALPQHITLSQLPKLSKYWNTVNTCTCKRWDFSSPLCLPPQTSCHRLAGITRATRTPPPSSSLSPSACSFHSWNYHSFVSWECWCL